MDSKNSRRSTNARRVGTKVWLRPCLISAARHKAEADGRSRSNWVERAVELQLRGAGFDEGGVDDKA